MATFHNHKQDIRRLVHKLVVMFSFAVVCVYLFYFLNGCCNSDLVENPDLNSVNKLLLTGWYDERNRTFPQVTTSSYGTLEDTRGSPVLETNSTAKDWTATRRLPHALIIGVKKGGTRALLEFLRLHPDIRALGSEPHFFDRHYARGLDWYRSMMPKALDGQIVMEKTPRYFVTEETPARIYAMSHDIKLIVVVRDPITRAISDYTQIISKTPDVPSFEALTFKNGSSASAGTTGQIDALWSPLWIGLYAKHLERWLAYFPLSQIHFVHGERLISDPAGELGRVQDFLGLQRIVTDKHFYFNKTKGFPCLKKPEGSSKPHCLGKTKGRIHPRIHPTVIQKLREFYQPHNLRFYQMAGQDFGWQ
ncbi:hypothetical protein AALO_G00277420 [Alosa alosa]|uniref:Sulfotransferase n=1 Tax=Alosa alosa TaxID=278164 RepID=A0AAV6FIX5_9TELE|nr:heparan sulfate (glucosamine) 3-O-sulfotransferase 3-like [Alosa alosa]KAG5262658.1 hypothetical protein AALO_G00277420 [Alosa alosa]